MENRKIIYRPGKTSGHLWSKLDELKNKYRDIISKEKIEISLTRTGANIKASKKLFIKFWIDLDIKILDGQYELTWKTNIPKSKISEALGKIEKML